MKRDPLAGLPRGNQSALKARNEQIVNAVRAFEFQAWSDGMEKRMDAAMASIQRGMTAGLYGPYWTWAARRLRL